MSFGPFRISCVSRQIYNTTVVFVCVMSVVKREAFRGGGSPTFLTFCSNACLSQRLCKCSPCLCFLGIRAGQNRLLYQDVNGAA